MGRTRKKKQVVVGILGATLDRRGKNRWSHWRPTVDICRHEDLVIDRFELLAQPEFMTLAKDTKHDIEQVSPETEVIIRSLPMEDPWEFEGVYAKLLDFAMSYRFDPDKEDYLIHISTGTHVAQISLFLLSESRYLPGRLLQSSPPVRRGDTIGTYRIIDLDLSRYDQIASRFKAASNVGVSVLKSGIETRNPRFNALIEEIETVAVRSKAPLLLTGPTGVGKTSLARKIFELKKTRHQLRGPFVELNCATVRGEQAMSMLFGHVKGAFTGAVQARTGLLKKADDGLLFLDEIGELGLDEQAMLLRALEDRRFLPVGSDSEQSSQFQLIAGTNRDLEYEVVRGAFREDLLARINLWTFRLPRLRDRPEDVEPNLLHELSRISQRDGQALVFSEKARREFLAFAISDAATWPGNFRDFAGSIERMVVLAAGGRIDAAVVQREIARLKESTSASKVVESLREREEFPHVTKMLGDEIHTLDLFDLAQLERVLAVCARSTSLAEASRTLFAQSRKRRNSVNDGDRLRKYLAKFSLDAAVLGRDT